MITAAGILFLTKTKQALFLKRGAGGDYPGYWCLPGGKQEAGETIEQCAMREAVEEVGQLPKGKRTLLTRSKSLGLSPEEPLSVVPPQVAPSPVEAAPLLPGQAAPGEEVDFTTFLQKVDDTFEPVPDAEHVGHCWSPVDQPPEPLHPGVRIAIERLTMNELGVARAMAAGKLTSPQRYENISLFNIRITGTGAAYRSRLKEFVWRDASIYLNDDFLARCNGLPVIYEHPEKAVLNSKEFANLVVGTVFVPYIKGDEVWAIVKIWDDATIDEMEDEQLSTSPAVVFKDPTVNTRLGNEDGSTTLIEGDPSLLDHIAICAQGVWDKGGKPRGIESANLTTAGEELAMADEDKKSEVKDDADAGEKLDKILVGLDSAHKRFDAIEERMDAEKTRMDGFEKFRKDSEEEKDSKKDADDGKMKEEAKELVADKKKDSEEEEKKKDSKKDEDEAMMDKKKDADEEKDDKKADSDMASIRAAIADMAKRIPADRSDEDRAAFADAQVRADEVFNALGQRAPAPMQGERLMDYKRRLANKLKPHSKAWKDVKIEAFADDAGFGVVEQQIYADAVQAANSPVGLAENTILGRSRRLSTGHDETRFVGNTSFVRSFSRQGRRVTGMNLRREGAAN